MKRNLKALGLALVAVLAISAVVASAASAATHDFKSNAQETILQAEAIGDQTFISTADDELRLLCKKISISSTIVGKTVSEVTVEPHYGECGIYNASAEKLAVAKVTTKGCHYLLTGGTVKTEPEITEGEYALAHLSCPEGVTGMTVDATVLNTECLHIPEQTLKGVQYKNTEEGGIKKIDVTFKAHGIKSETTHHPVVCETPSKGTQTHEGGILKGEVKVSGTSEPEVLTSLWTEETP
jgi:hypothetical protein